MTSSLDPKALVRERLANGLTVLCYRNDTAPVVAINTYVNAGYFDETDDVVGIAHVLEHMFFKGTERRGVGEIAKETKALGGYLNAHTIYDHTSYYTVLPASAFARGLEIQADAYANSVIDAQELARELEVIIQEAKRKEDNPGAVSTETLYTLLYDAHRIRRWRIGREDALRALTRDAVLVFYRNFYTPSNTILAIAGAIDVDMAMREVGRRYGSLPDHVPVRVAGPEEPDHTGFRYRELHGDVAQTHVEIGWRTVPGTHPDAPALDVTASVLGTGRASRLYRAVRDRQLAGAVAAYHYSPHQVGVFAAGAETEPEQALSAARAMWAQLRLVGEAPVSPDELERVRRLFASRWARRLETTEGQAAHLAEWESAGGWEQGDAYYDAVMRVGAPDVLRVAQQYLAPDRAGMVTYRPERSAPLAPTADAVRATLDAPGVTPLAHEAAPLAPAPVVTTATPFVREEGGVRVYHTRAGVPILVRARPGAAITYAGVYATGGVVQEHPAHAGITALAVRSVPKGTATRTALEIAEASELLGGSIASSAAPESFGWSISVPRDNVDAAIALLADVVQHATLAPETVETERTVLRSDLAQLRDDMYHYPMQLMHAAAFAGHPYGMSALGTEASLRTITRDDVAAWYQRTLLRAPFVIAIVGDVEPDHAAGVAAAQFAALPCAAPAAVATPAWPARLVQRVESRDKAQTALALAFPAPSRRDDDRFAAHLLATIASGLGGRFFDELRDRQSLAYTVHAFASEYRQGGAFVAYIATSPDREDVARDGLLREFATLREHPVTAAELARAIQYTLGMHDIRQERGGAVLGAMVDAWLLGNGLRELPEFRDRVARVSADDILRLAVRYFDADRRVEGVVRGRRRS